MEYEFCLRATPVRGGVQERQRSLGELLRQPEDPDRVQFSAYSLAEDLINIPRQLKEIERSLEAGLGDDGYSRLVHYHKRLRRYVPETDELFQQRKILLDGIERLSRKYYQIDLAHVGRQVPLSRVNTLQSNWAPVNPVQSGQDLVDMTVDSGEGAVGGILEDRPARAANAPPVNTAMVQETLQPRYTGTKPKASRDLLATPVPAPRQGGQSSYNQWLYGFSPADAGPNESIRPLGSNAPGWRQPATTDRNNSTLTLPEDQPRRTQPQSNYVRGLFGHTSGSVPPPTHQPQSQVNMGRSAATSSPTPTLRNEPIEETDLNEYIHVSDVKDYLRACLEQLMKQELNGEPVPTEAVDNIAEQVANVNLRNDSEMLQISQGLGRGPANHVPDSFRRTFPKQPGPQVFVQHVRIPDRRKWTIRTTIKRRGASVGHPSELVNRFGIDMNPDRPQVYRFVLGTILEALRDHRRMIRMDALEASLNKSTVHQIDLEEGCLEDEHDPELVYALQGRQGKFVRSKKENQPGSAEQRMESVMYDLKLFAKIDCLEDAEALQRELDKFADWCEANHMVLNPACAAVTICTNRTEGVYRCCATRAVRQHTAPLCPVHPVEAKQVHERPRPDSGRELCADERVGAERLRRPRGDSENCTPARETTCPRGTRTLRRIEEAAPAIETAASKQGAAVQPPGPYTPHTQACAAVTICTNRTEGVYRCCATRAVRQHTAPLCPVHPVEAKQVHERPRPDSGRELCADERVGAERLRRPRGDSENCTPARETTCPRGTRTLRRIEETAPAIETAASKQGAAVQPPGPYTPHTQALKNDDVNKNLVATTHVDSTAYNFQMESYVILGRTWEKLQMAARCIASIEYPGEMFAFSLRQFGKRFVLRFANYTEVAHIAGRFTSGAMSHVC
ncbi:hypothetical protein quinque_002365 [Culex quinquefasciatus]